MVHLDSVFILATLRFFRFAIRPARSVASVQLPPVVLLTRISRLPYLALAGRLDQ